MAPLFTATDSLSFRDLKERLGDQIPNSATGRWRASAVQATFQVVDGIVRGTEDAAVPEGAVAMKPIELILNAKSAAGWREIERMRQAGVPYEYLLAQRTVGSAWGAHRNRTSSKLLQVVASQLCRHLDELGIGYRRSKSIGGIIRPSEIRRLSGCSAHVGLVILGRSNQPKFGVAFSIARDGGTARKNAGRLQATVRTAGIPVALVVAGPGWSQRNETADLAAAFRGQVYSDRTVSALAHTIYENVRARTLGAEETQNGTHIRGSSPESH